MVMRRYLEGEKAAPTVTHRRPEKLSGATVMVECDTVNLSKSRKYTA